MFIIVAILYLFTIYSLIKAFERVERDASVSAMRKTAWWMVAVFTLLALLPLVAHSKDRSLFHFFLIFPLLYAVLFRKITRFFIYPARKWLKLRYLIIFVSTWIIETFLVIDYNRTGFQQNYGVERKIIYGNPEALGLHLYSYIGFYVGLALVLGFFLWKYKISLKWAFITGGLWGVLVEQNFLGIKMLFTNPVLFSVFGPWTFITYGMYVAGAYLLFYEEISGQDRKETKYLKLKFFLALAIIPLVSWGLWSKLIGW